MKPAEENTGADTVPWHMDELLLPDTEVAELREKLRRAPGQGKPVPAFMPRHSYGRDGTIHRTGTIDIQLSSDGGEVIAVWFRCLSLPFTVSKMPYSQPVVNPDASIAIEEITYAELSRETE